jgi:OOP family OmpA-OmpF porin
MLIRPSIAIIAGALITSSIAVVAGTGTDHRYVAPLNQQAEQAIAEIGAEKITASFVNRFGWPTRHPLLSGGESYNEATRDKVAKSIAGIEGVGGVSWADGTGLAQVGEIAVSPLHCQDDVQALLQARTIRFEESSSSIEASSRELLDEVAAALRPCLGSIIAITGHTDSTGQEPGNLALSRARAEAVQTALIDRGIPADGLRAQGVGSSQPVEGLLPEDPANRRIEFAVIETVPLIPTPVDTPGPR